MKKAKKYIKDTVGVSMLAAGGSLALGGIGGAAAVHGQTGLSNMTKFMGTTGKIKGASMLMGTIKKWKKNY